MCFVCVFFQHLVSVFCFVFSTPIIIQTVVLVGANVGLCTGYTHDTQRPSNVPNTKMKNKAFVRYHTMQAAQEEEKRLVARVVHLMRNDDTDRYFRMLVVARRHLGQVFCAAWAGRKPDIIIVSLSLSLTVSLCRHCGDARSMFSYSGMRYPEYTHPVIAHVHRWSCSFKAQATCRQHNSCSTIRVYSD